jgi:hypothetical protein
MPFPRLSVCPLPAGGSVAPLPPHFLPPCFAPSLPSPRTQLCRNRARTPRPAAAHTAPACKPPRVSPRVCPEQERGQCLPAAHTGDRKRHSGTAGEGCATQGAGLPSCAFRVPTPTTASASGACRRRRALVGRALADAALHRSHHAPLPRASPPLFASPSPCFPLLRLALPPPRRSLAVAFAAAFRWGGQARQEQAARRQGRCWSLG